MAKANRLLEAALEIQAFCRDRRWRFCFIGGMAVQHWGEARLTRDADVELFTGIGDESSYVDTLLDTFDSRIADPQRFAAANRVLLLRASNRIPLDVSLGALPFEEKAVTDARDEEIVTGVRLRLASPGTRRLQGFRRPRTGLARRRGNHRQVRVSHRLGRCSRRSRDTPRSQG